MKNILIPPIEYHSAKGEAAFYGPKLDIQYKNVHGKEDTIITNQIDFALPERSICTTSTAMAENGPMSCTDIHRLL